MGKEKVASNIRADHELFLQSFEKPTQIYKFLSYRHSVNPVFLHRTLTYMAHRKLRRGRQKFHTVDEVCKELHKKAAKTQQTAAREGSLKIAITNVENKESKSSTPETVEIQVYVHKMCQKRKNSEEDYVESELISTLKYTINDKLSAKSPSKLHPVTSIRASSLTKHVGGKGSVFEVRVKLRSTSAGTDQSPPKKRQCREEWYTADVVLQNNKGDTLLGDGSYHLYLKPMKSKDWAPAQVTWETLGTLAEEDFLSSDLLPEDVPPPDQSSITFSVCSEGLKTRSTSSPTKKVKDKAGCVMTAQAEREPVNILYNFLYNGSTQQQTESRNNSICPWCNLDCWRLYSLLEHLACCHPRFRVSYIPGNSGCYELDVEVDEVANLSHPSRPDQDLFPYLTGPNKRKPFTLELNQSMSNVRRSVRNFMALDVSPYKSPHNRLYFHSRSYQPVLPSEMDYDSESEPDVEWIKKRTKQLILDFTDVNDGEKEIMIMWNCFILPVKPLSDRKMPELISKFSKENGETIVSKGLVKNFLLHLTNLHSFGLIKAQDLQRAMLYIYSLENKIVEAKLEGVPSDTVLNTTLA